IDSDYRGEVLVLARNQNPTIPFAINKGDRITQMVILPVAQPKVQGTDKLKKTKRGEGRFGSTGKVLLATRIMELNHKEETKEKVYQIGEKFPMRNTLTKVLDQYRDVIATTFEDIKTNTPRYYHHVDTGDNKPIYQKARPIPPAYHEWLKTELNNMEEAGIIKKASSPWASPIILAPKKGSKPREFAPRLCVDY